MIGMNLNTEGNRIASARVLVDRKLLRAGKARINNEALASGIRLHAKEATVDPTQDLELRSVGENINDPLTEDSQRTTDVDSVASLPYVVVPPCADRVGCGREGVREVDIHESSSSVGDGRGRAPRKVSKPEPTEEEQ